MSLFIHWPVSYFLLYEESIPNPYWLGFKNLRNQILCSTIYFIQDSFRAFHSLRIALKLIVLQSIFSMASLLKLWLVWRKGPSNNVLQRAVHRSLSAFHQSLSQHSMLLFSQTERIQSPMTVIEKSSQRSVQFRSICRL